MLGSIGYFAVGSIGKLPLITMIFEKLVKPLKKREKGEGHIGTQKFAFGLPEYSSFYGTHWLQFEVI